MRAKRGITKPRKYVYIRLCNLKKKFLFDIYVCRDISLKSFSNVFIEHFNYFARKTAAVKDLGK